MQPSMQTYCRAANCKALSIILAIPISITVALAPFKPASAATIYFQPTPAPRSHHIDDLWTSSFYDHGNHGIINDDKLQVGGWGDTYCTYLKFDDLKGLPAQITRATLYLHSYDRGDLSTPTPMKLGKPSVPWSEAWALDPKYNASSFISTFYANTPAPAKDVWFPIDISTLYRSWRTSTKNNSISICPLYINNNFDVFRSSNYPAPYPYRGMTKDHRPTIAIDFIPQETPFSMKMPLPAGSNWVVTTEIGGTDCATEGIDPYHTNSKNRYFSLDITNSAAPTTDIPILAPADGIVTKASGGTADHDHGYYVILDHDPGVPAGGDGLATTGYQTILDNMKYRPLVKAGQPVKTGQRLGIMGCTGECYGPGGKNDARGTHLHLTLRHRGNSKHYDDLLTEAQMEGLILKQYQTECSGGNRIATYISTTQEVK